MSSTVHSHDTKSKSLSEAFVNSFGSYPIGYAIGILILPFSINWLQEDLFLANVFVTLVFASISFVRVYSLRRIFEKFGYDDNFIKLAIKIYRKSVKLIPQQVSAKRNRTAKSLLGVL